MNHSVNAAVNDSVPDSPPSRVPPDQGAGNKGTGSRERVGNSSHPTQRFVTRENATMDGWGSRHHQAMTAIGSAEPGLRCCRLHNFAGCCDPDDCGPCCEYCPTCPTIARWNARHDSPQANGVTEQPTDSRPVTPVVARYPTSSMRSWSLQYLADQLMAEWAEGDRLRVEVERTDGDLAVALVEASAARAALLLSGVRWCRRCGCVDVDCTACLERTGQRCCWVEPLSVAANLCSACLVDGDVR